MALPYRAGEVKPFRRQCEARYAEDVTESELVAELKRMREAANLSQRQLAEQVGHSQGWVNKIETGQRKIDLSVADVWARACGRELQLHFFDRERERKAQPIYEAAQRLDDSRRDLAREFLELAHESEPAVIDTAIRMLERLRGLRPAEAAPDQAAPRRTFRAQ